jgi:septum formation protein
MYCIQRKPGDLSLMQGQLLLASGSPRRRKLMTEAGYHFDVIIPDVEESIDPSLSARQLTEGNAMLKASAVSNANPDAIVIGADTLVFLGSEPLGKPDNLPAAEAMLTRMLGKTHQVCTGVAILKGAPIARQIFHVMTEVTFKPLSPGELSAYLALINPLDKAGGYAAQEYGEKIIASISGSYTNVVGLPMDELSVSLSDKFDIRPERQDHSS